MIKHTHIASILDEQFEVELELSIEVDKADPSVGIFHDCGWIEAVKICSVKDWDDDKQAYVQIPLVNSILSSNPVQYDNCLIGAAVNEYVEKEEDRILEEASEEQAAADEAAAEAYWEDRRNGW